MKKLLITSAALVALAAPAYAQTCSVTEVTDSAGNTWCDPTSFHVTSPTASGSDPVLLNESKTFTVDDTNNGKANLINPPLWVLFVEPVGTALPVITSATGTSFNGTANVPINFGPVATAVLDKFEVSTLKPPAPPAFNGPAVTLTAGEKLSTQAGITGGGMDSLSYANFQTEYAKLGLTLPTTFDVYVAAFTGMTYDSQSDFLTIDGTFAKGTIIAPLALDIAPVLKKGVLDHFDITAYDTSWTNAAIVNATSVVPEPSTWVMGLIGFGLMGLFGLYRTRHGLAAST